MAKYSELLKDPRWLEKRESILERDNYKCQDCLCKGSELHVHHKKYIDGRMPWEYPNELLITLCGSCHKRVHTGDYRPLRERPCRLYDVPINSRPVRSIGEVIGEMLGGVENYG